MPPFSSTITVLLLFAKLRNNFAIQLEKNEESKIFNKNVISLDYNLYLLKISR